jgi:nucleotide-binding universal stress UspA family protein
MAEQKILRIILAHDGSEHARAAEALLLGLPLSPLDQILVLSVFDPEDPDEREIRAGTLDIVRRDFERNKLQIETSLTAGHPADIIQATARQWRADLVVMGAKGLQATLGFLLGGVAQQVVENAEFPVLVVRAPYNGLQRVLLAQDGSDHGQRALQYLCNQAQGICLPLPSGVEVVSATVIPPFEMPGTYLQTTHIGPEFLSQSNLEQSAIRHGLLTDNAKALLNSSVEDLKECGLNANSMLLHGEPASSLLEYARGNEIDLIVAGSRGLSRMEGWLMGSVSRKLVHYASCSVLIIK